MATRHGQMIDHEIGARVASEGAALGEVENLQLLVLIDNAQYGHAGPCTRLDPAFHHKISRAGRANWR